MTAEQPIKILCVDDHPLVRKGIASILANEGDMQLVGEAGNGREAVKQYLRDNPVLVEEISRKVLEKRGLTPAPTGAAAENGQVAEAPAKPEPSSRKESRRQQAAAE